MIKKKYFLLLSMLLLTVLLGFCTSSYAFVPTENELKNFICNYALYYNANFDIDGLKTYLDSHSSDLQSWIGYLRNYEGRYILSGANGRVMMWVYTGNETNLRTYGPYRYQQQVYANNSYLSRFRWDLIIYTGNYEFTNWSASDTYIGSSTNQYFYYTDTNIYTNSVIANGSIWGNHGSSNPNRDLFSGFYTDSAFDIDINADFRNNKATISNDTSGTEYYLIPYNSNKIRIGNMFDYSNLAGVVKRKFRYKESTRSFELFQEYQADSNNLEFFDVSDDTLIVFEYYQPDTTEFITFIPKEDTNFSQFTIALYYTTANTSIINGVIDNGNTFSGDYYNNYNNDSNTDKIINNVNDDSNVVGQLNEFVSGDTEDLAKKLGFQLIGGMDYYNFIQNTIRNTFNILAEEENVYFDYSMHGEIPTRIYASDFTTSPSLFKTFGCLFLIACTIFVFYFQMTTFFESLATLQFTSAIDWLTIDRSIFRM